MNLFEAYKKRLTIAEKVYAAKHNGESMDNQRKLVVATCLKNINSLMNESFGSGAATQSVGATSVAGTTTLGDYKKFSLNLVNVALPNLIAHDLVMVHPMTSFSGYVNYLQYQYSADKGGIEAGTRIADPFGFENNTAKGFENYTAAVVVEPVASDATECVLSWTPVVGTVYGVKANGTKEELPVVDNKVSFEAGTYVKVTYQYDNVVIPQNKLPTIKAVMQTIPLLAHARRIVVYYSQVAAFQAKTDYGFDLGDALAERAVSELSYEIDTKVVKLLSEMAGPATGNLIWSKTLPVGVSKREHYAGFMETLDAGAAVIYNNTQKFEPNWIIVARDVLNVFNLIDAFKPAATGAINGPYLAGTIGALKVFVSPAFESGRFVIGVLGNDLYSAAAVYAPYMPIIPTQLLGFSDGAMSQGWSTLYDLKPLNTNLVVAGQITA